MTLVCLKKIRVIRATGHNNAGHNIAARIIRDIVSDHRDKRLMNVMRKRKENDDALKNVKQINVSIE